MVEGAQQKSLGSTKEALVRKARRQIVNVSEKGVLFSFMGKRDNNNFSKKLIKDICM